MAKTVTVMNRTERQIVLPVPKKRHKGAGETRQGVRLSPGANLVEEQLLQDLFDQGEKGSGAAKKTGLYVRNLFDRGTLGLQEEKDKHEANRDSATEAIAYIKECDDPAEVARIRMNDTRKTVIEAADARIDELSKKR